MTRYFKRFWDETTGDELTDTWGTSAWYFETTKDGEVLRQLEIFANGQRLKYSEDHIEDEYGGLADQSLDMIEFEDFKITKEEFESVWEQ